MSPAEAIRRLRAATQTPHHAHWPCDPSLLDPQAFDATRIYGPKQVTDVYLLALAAHHDGRFVTFDRAVPLAAVPGATAEHLVVL